MAFANTKVKLTQDEWNKFQLINAALCSGFTSKVVQQNNIDIFGNPIGKPKLEQVNLFMPEHGGFSLNSASAPNDWAVKMFNNIILSHNYICCNEAQYCVSPATDITPSPLISLKFMDPLRNLQPIDLFKLSCQQLKKDPKAKDNLAAFIQHVSVNYDNCIKGLEILTWGKNIAAALAENKKLIEEVKGSMIASGDANVRQ